jgi:hypothetical protein
MNPKKSKVLKPGVKAAEQTTTKGEKANRP